MSVLDTLLPAALEKHPTVLLLGSCSEGTRQSLKSLATFARDAGERALIHSSAHPDVILRDARELNTEGARELRSTLTAMPAKWRHRYLVLPYIDRLHDSAAQSLLKLIEEPPSSLRTLLITNRIEVLPPTIVSRSVVLNVPYPTEAVLEEQLAEAGIEEPSWRAHCASGDFEIAREIDLDITKKWSRHVAIVFSGTPPSSEIPLTWAPIFREMEAPTFIGCMNLIVRAAAKRGQKRAWQELGQLAMKAREVAMKGQLNVIFNVTTLIQIYAAMKRSTK